MPPFWPGGGKPRKKVTQRAFTQGTSRSNDDSDGAQSSVAQVHMKEYNDTEWPQTPLSRINGGSAITSLMFLACGRRIAALRKGDNKVQLWTLDNDRLEEIESPNMHDIAVSAISTSRDGKWIVTGDDDRTMVIWDATTLQAVAECKPVKGDAGKITALDISSDSTRIAIGSETGMMVVWSIERGEQELGPLQRQNVILSSVSSIKFSPLGGRIASGHLDHGRGDHSILLWNSHTGALLKSIGNPRSIYCLAWSIDGHRLFAGGLNGSIRSFNVLTQITIEWQAFPKHRDLISSLSVSDSGQFLVSTSSGRTIGMDVWDICRVPSMPCKPLCSHDGVLLASISQDDTRLVSLGKDDDVALWSLPTVIPESYLTHCLSLSATVTDPFMYVNKVAFELWKAGKLAEAEKKMSEEIGNEKSPRNSYTLSNRALIRVSRRNWGDVLRDVRAIKEEQSNTGRVALIAHIAKGVAFHGQGECSKSVDAFQSALCHPECGSNIKNLVKCIKSVALLEFPDKLHGGADIDDDLPNNDLHNLVVAWKHFHGTRDCLLDRKNFNEALNLLNEIPPLDHLLHLSEVEIVSLIFNRSHHDLISDIHELRCRALFKCNQSPQVGAILNYFSAKKTETDLSEELETIQAKLGSISEGFGNEALFQGKYNEAVSWYSEALVLAGYPSDVVNRELLMPEGDWTMSQYLLARCPQCIAHLLARRSEAKAGLNSWEDAVRDATVAIKSDQLYPLGYERQFIVLHALGRFKDAVSTLRTMSSKFMDTDIQDIRLLQNYSKINNEINSQLSTIFDRSPFVLIDINDGRLRHREERRTMFESDARYYELVSSMSTKPDMHRIEKEVGEYFQYVMFSHTWEGEEPSFKIVSATPVYRLDPMSPQNLKLSKFCETVRDDYKCYRWSWSDTCCIDKEDRDVYDRSIRFMYKWYHHSTLTLVLLAHPSRSPLVPNSTRLKDNRWMFRVWTLQELLAPKVIHFYKRNWQLYIDGIEHNHKTIPAIKAELQGGMNNVEGTLEDDFSPASLTVRQRLHMASTREATVKVDVAYALVGIFNSDIHVEYAREGEIALGLLLQEIVNRQGDTTVLDWIGQPSKFNSALPADISVYKPGPYQPYKLPIVMDDVVERRAESLDPSSSLLEDVAGVLGFLLTLGLPRFSDRRLSLPCITFLADIQRASTAPDDATAYVASTAALGQVRFKTSETLPKGRVVLVFPWIRDLLAQIRHRRGNRRARASRLIVHLEQGFRALLFVEKSDQQYKRVATDEDIVVPAHGLMTMEDVGVETLEIWERS